MHIINYEKCDYSILGGLTKEVLSEMVGVKGRIFQAERTSKTKAHGCEGT